jgi:hypothetical protein
VPSLDEYCRWIRPRVNSGPHSTAQVLNLRFKYTQNHPHKLYENLCVPHPNSIRIGIGLAR